MAISLTPNVTDTSGGSGDPALGFLSSLYNLVNGKTTDSSGSQTTTNSGSTNTGATTTSGSVNSGTVQNSGSTNTSLSDIVASITGSSTGSNTNKSTSDVTQNTNQQNVGSTSGSSATQNVQQLINNSATTGSTSQSTNQATTGSSNQNTSTTGSSNQATSTTGTQAQTTTNSGSTNVTTTTGKLDQAGMNAMLKSALESNNGLASVMEMGHEAGVYDSATQGQLANDLVSRLIGEIAKGNESQTTTQNVGGSTSTTSGTSNQVAQTTGSNTSNSSTSGSNSSNTTGSLSGTTASNTSGTQSTTGSSATQTSGNSLNNITGVNTSVNNTSSSGTTASNSNQNQNQSTTNTAVIGPSTTNTTQNIGGATTNTSNVIGGNTSTTAANQTSTVGGLTGSGVANVGAGVLGAQALSALLGGTSGGSGSGGILGTLLNGIKTAINGAGSGGLGGDSTVVAGGGNDTTSSGDNIDMGGGQNFGTDNTSDFSNAFGGESGGTNDIISGGGDDNTYDPFSGYAKGGLVTNRPGYAEGGLIDLITASQKRITGDVNEINSLTPRYGANSTIRLDTGGGIDPMLAAMKFSQASDNPIQTPKVIASANTLGDAGAKLLQKSASNVAGNTKGGGNSEGGGASGGMTSDPEATGFGGSLGGKPLEAGNMSTQDLVSHGITALGLAGMPVIPGLAGVVGAKNDQEAGASIALGILGVINPMAGIAGSLMYRTLNKLNEGRQTEDDYQNPTEQDVQDNLDKNVLDNPGDAYSDDEMPTENDVLEAGGGSGPGGRPDQPEEFSVGGMIRGPGTPTSDNIGINVSPGEFVINAAAVQKLGLPMLQYINSLGGGNR